MDTLIAFVLSFLVTVFGGAPAQTDVDQGVHETATAEVVRVIDGDTIEVRINNEVVKVRYIGIDTPEPYQEEEPECYSTEASQRNTELVAEQVVTLVSDVEDTDRYGRLLRYVYVGEKMINQILIEEGYATKLQIPPNTRYASEFQAAEATARNNGFGLWSVCKAVSS